MGRPRKHDTGLPQCVFLRNGAYYFVKGKKWHYLAKDRDTAILRAAEYTPLPVGPTDSLRAHLVTKFTMLKARPQTRTGRLKQVTVDAAYVVALAEANEWRCAVTGVKMTLEVVKGRKPYAPSIDRIDCDFDYVPGNIRIVCTAANLAMNVWGEKVLLRLTRGIVSRRARILDNVQKSNGQENGEAHEQGVSGAG